MQFYGFYFIFQLFRSKVTVYETSQGPSKNKRKADGSPPIERKKRLALGNLTNANVVNQKGLNEKNKSNAAIQKQQILKTSCPTNTIKQEVLTIFLIYL